MYGSNTSLLITLSIGGFSKTYTNIIFSSRNRNRNYYTIQRVVQYYSAGEKGNLYLIKL